MRLIDADQFEVITFKEQSEKFSDGVMWMLNKIDEAPTITPQEIMGEAAEMSVQLEQNAIKYGEEIAYEKVIDLICAYPVDNKSKKEFDVLSDLMHHVRLLKQECYFERKKYEPENRCI